MLKNYFKTAWRSLMRHKIFALINISGLAIGISAALVIYLIVYYDFSFDHFEKDNDRIYRVVSDMNFSGTPIQSSAVQAPLAGVVKNEVASLQTVAPFHQLDDDSRITVINSVSGNKTLKKQDGVIFADKNYFDIVNYQWVAGSAAVSLKQPNQVVLTEPRAREFFPNTQLADILGKQIIYNDSIPAIITGIVKPLAHNSDFIFHDFISLSTIPNKPGLKEYFSWDNWGMTNGTSQLYIKLLPGSNPKHVEDQLAIIEKKYDKKPADTKNTTVYKLQPLSDLHFNSDYPIYGTHEAKKMVLYSLLTIAGFLLILGCINFINLSTAQATQRAKEIGIRKTMGSSKRQLVMQFLSETFLIAFFATILSVLFTPFILKSFVEFIPAGVNINLLKQPQCIIFIVVLLIVVTLLAGFYPSWVLAQYKPISVLKNQTSVNGGQTRKTWIRQTLTIFQFLVAQVFIMAVFIVAKQIHYNLNQDMGFKKDAIIFFNTPFRGTVADRDLLMNKLHSIPEIERISLGGGPPAAGGSWTGPGKFKDGKTELEVQMEQKRGDTNYLNLYHIKLLAGRAINPDQKPQEVIVNEHYVKMLGYKKADDIIGKFIMRDDVKQPIVGVVNDFHQHSFHKAIQPLLFAMADEHSSTFHIALRPPAADGINWQNAISKINKAYKQVYPQVDFDYTFYDKKIAEFYQNDQNTSTLLRWAAGLAIFISCLGLLGLVIFTTNQRTKEIGVRKVLGASATRIVMILSVDFVRLVLFAFVVAAPIAWYGMNKWLQNFAYRTSINWWIFALSGLFMILIALLTLSYQTVKAAIANPVKSLRSE